MSTVNYVNQVLTPEGRPTCHVCGAEMVAKEDHRFDPHVWRTVCVNYWKCLSCGEIDEVPAPAADAGPRQPEGTCDTLGFPHREGSGKGISVTHPKRPSCLNWQIAPDYPAAPPVPQEAAPPKLTCGCECDCHCGFCEHCRTHKVAPPVPQEAASQHPENCRCPRCQPDKYVAIPANTAYQVDEATAPDEAMRVAKAVLNFQNPNHIGDDARICFCAECEDARAALIRQAGSERERALEDALRKYGRHSVNCNKYNTCECGWPEASRLLGGESD